MNKNYKNVVLSLLPLVVAAGLSAIGLFLGNPMFMAVVLFIGVVIGLNGWSSSNFSKQSFGGSLVIVLIITFGLGGLYGGYVLLNPAHRAAARNEPILRATREAIENTSIQAANALIESAGLNSAGIIERPKGKLLVVIKTKTNTHMADIVRSPRYSFGAGFNYVTIPESIEFTSDFHEAGAVLWIEESAAIVGSYNRKILGPVTAGKTGNALLYTWQARLIDIASKQIIATETFKGAFPPATTEVTGDFGLTPQSELANWLLNLMNIEN